MARGQVGNQGAIQAVRTGSNTFKVLDWGNSGKDPSVGIVFKDPGQLSEAEMSVLTGDASPANEWTSKTSAANVAGERAAGGGGGGAPAGGGGGQPASGGGQFATTEDVAAAMGMDQPAVAQPARGDMAGGVPVDTLPPHILARQQARESQAAAAAAQPTAAPAQAAAPPQAAAQWQTLPGGAATNVSGAANVTPTQPGQYVSAVPQSPFFQNMSVAEAAANPERMNLQAINQRIQQLEELEVQRAAQNAYQAQQAGVDQQDAADLAPTVSEVVTPLNAYQNVQYGLPVNSPTGGAPAPPSNEEYASGNAYRNIQAGNTAQTDPDVANNVNALNSLIQGIMMTNPNMPMAVPGWNPNFGQ